MSAIIPFDFETNAVRVVMIDAAPWFVTLDVCRVLEISKHRDAVSKLDDDERSEINPLDLNVHTAGRSSGSHGGARRLGIVSESGLYGLIFQSNKPSARRFRKWVTAEVLPAIRRDGAYRLPHPEQAELEMKRAFAAALPEAQKAKAATKANAVRHFHKLIDDGSDKTPAVIEAASAAGIGERTLWQALSVTWFVAPSDYEAALAPRWRANPERKLLSECHPDAMIRWLQMKPHKSEVSEAYRRLLVEAEENGWFPIPSERTMRRTLHKLGIVMAKEVAHV